jgi:hypothetical protein
MTGDEKTRRLQIALDYGGNTHSIGDVVNLLKRGDATLFENADAGIIAELHHFPRYTAVHFWLLFGELRSVLALEHDVLPWAIEQGATVATACGRRGWGRVAAPTGWRPWQPNFYKPLVREH